MDANVVGACWRGLKHGVKRSDDDIALSLLDVITATEPCGVAVVHVTRRDLLLRMRMECVADSGAAISGVGAALTGDTPRPLPMPASVSSASARPPEKRRLIVAGIVAYPGPERYLFFSAAPRPPGWAATRSG
jgi:hypothetical protein